jgi:hypothetical protein
MLSSWQLFLLILGEVVRLDEVGILSVRWQNIAYSGIDTERSGITGEDL